MYTHTLTREHHACKKAATNFCGLAFFFRQRKTLEVFRMVAKSFAMACALFLSAPLCVGQQLSEEFDRTFVLAPTGRVALKNVVGAVRISGWDRDEVSVRAIKRARTQEALNEVRIEVKTLTDGLSIETKYPERARDRSNGTSVEYEVKVPRRARLEPIETVVGAVTIEGFAGSVRASVVTGSIEARFVRLGDGQNVALSAVTGSISVVLPSDADVEVRADVVSGRIRSDFGLVARRSGFVGQRVAGRLASGRARLRLDSVTGSIAILRVDGRRKAGEVKDSASGDENNALRVDRRTEEAISDDVRRQVDEDTGKTVAEAVRSQVDEAMRLVEREIERAQQEARRAIEMAFENWDRARREKPFTERETKRWTVADTPTLRAGTFDGEITVHVWERSEIAIDVIKRASSAAQLRAIELLTETSGNTITARVVKSGGAFSGGSASLEVFVPRRANLRLETSDGWVRVAGVEGELDLATDDGAIEVQDCRGRLRARSGDGRITVRRFVGGATARTGDGSLILQGRFDDLEAHTGDGSIYLELPADFDATLEADAEKVLVQGLNAAQEFGSGRTSRWRIGRGGPSLKVRTGDGSVFLRPWSGEVGRKEESK